MRIAKQKPRSDDPTSVYEVARRLRALRLAKNLDTGQMAQRIGVSDSTWSNWETAVSRPKLNHGMVICKEFRVTLDWIYMGDASYIPNQLAEDITPYIHDE